MAKKSATKAGQDGSKKSKASKTKGKGIRKFRDYPYNPEDQGRAMDELKILQGIIAGQENNRLKLRSWGISLVSFFTMTFLSKGVLQIHPLAYFLVGLALVALFYALEIYHAVAEYRAMDRSREVEECLRRQKWGYYGPLIGITLIQRFRPGELKKTARNRRIYLPYAVMLIVILLSVGVRLISPLVSKG